MYKRQFPISIRILKLQISRFSSRGLIRTILDFLLRLENTDSMKHIIRIDRLSFFQDKHSINDCLPLQANDLIFDKGHISIYLVTEVPDIVPIPHIQLETFIAHLADITDRPIQTTYLIRQDVYKRQEYDCSGK